MIYIETRNVKLKRQQRAAVLLDGGRVTKFGNRYASHAADGVSSRAPERGVVRIDGRRRRSDALTQHGRRRRRALSLCRAHFALHETASHPAIQTN
ncbi:unnamed protein product, partial [Iphiclides podalirius]